jgi:hypothetical protein
MKLSVNLVTRRFPDPAGLRKIRNILVVLWGLWLAINLVAMTVSQLRHQKVQEELSAISGKKSSDKGDLAERQALQDEARKAERILKRRVFRWSRILDHLENTWVQGIQVRSIEPDFEKQTLSIRVLARDEAVFRAYLGKLLQYEAYSQVFLLRQENIEIKDGAGRSLSVLSCEFRIQGGF